MEDQRLYQPHKPGLTFLCDGNAAMNKQVMKKIINSPSLIVRQYLHSSDAGALSKGTVGSWQHCSRPPWERDTSSRAVRLHEILTVFGFWSVTKLDLAEESKHMIRICEVMQRRCTLHKHFKSAATAKPAAAHTWLAVMATKTPGATNQKGRINNGRIGYLRFSLTFLNYTFKQQIKRASVSFYLFKFKCGPNNWGQESTQKANLQRKKRTNSTLWNFNMSQKVDTDELKA